LTLLKAALTDLEVVADNVWEMAGVGLAGVRYWQSRTCQCARGLSVIGRRSRSRTFTAWCLHL